MIASTERKGQAMASFQPLTPQNAAHISELARARLGFITELAWSPDGLILAAAHGGGVTLWTNGFGGEPTRVIEGHDGPVKSLAFSPDGLVLATASADTTVRLTIVANSASLTCLRGHTGSVDSVAFSGNGALVASGGADRTIRVLDLAESTRRYVLQGHEDEVTDVAFGGALLASGSRDATIRLWTTRQEAVLEGHSSWVRALAWSPDGVRLASASRDATVRVWNIESGTADAVLEHEKDSRALAFSADGRLLAADDNGVIRVWDVETQQQVATLTGHGKPVLSLAFHPNGALLASAGGDNTIRMWGVTA